MKRLIFLLCCFLTAFSLKTTAGNILGAELTYSTIAPNLYTITLKQVRDCSVTLPASSYNLQLTSPGCGSLARVVTLNKVGTANLVPYYCPVGGSICAPFNQPGLALIYYFTATVTFSAAEVACSDWNMTLTINDDTRSATANVAGTPALYLEAYVKLGANINNSSVEFSSSKPAFSTAYVNSPNNYHITIAEVDGDSIVYAMRPALQAPATPVTYQAPFSAQNPFASNPASSFNAPSGLFQFTPNVFIQNVPRNQGSNRYAAAFQVDEYRKINGVATKVGTVSREMIFEIVEPDTTNRPPFFSNFTVNGLPLDTAQVLQLAVGQSVVVEFETDDPNPGDNLTFNQNPGGLPFANITVTDNGIKPKIEMVLAPTLHHTRPQNPYLYPFYVEDDGCPVKARTTGLLKFEVNGVTGIQAAIDKEFHFKAFPNPFTDAVNFIFEQNGKAETILIYNLLGQQIDEIQLKTVGSGEQKVQWENAHKHAAGTYIARLISEDKTIQTLKFTKVQ